MIQGPRNIHLKDIARYRFPLAAIASILHRISGIIIFFFIPFALWLLHASLASPQEFALLKDFMGSFWIGFLVWFLASATVYHLLAGVKHLVMDMGHLEERVSGRVASLVVIVLGLVAAVLIGVWIL